MRPLSLFAIRGLYQEGFFGKSLLRALSPNRLLFVALFWKEPSTGLFSKRALYL